MKFFKIYCSGSTSLSAKNCCANFKNTNAILYILIMIFCVQHAPKAENVLNLSPSASDACALYIGAAEVENELGAIQGNFGSFAYVDSPSKFYFNLQDLANEKVYIGFSQPCTKRELDIDSTFLNDVRFRIIDPQGNPITCWGAYGQNGAGGSGWQNIDNKDANIEIGSTGYNNVALGPNTGYTPFIFDPAILSCLDINQAELVGDYAIEFYQTNHDPSIGFFIENWEVAVYNGINKVPGRIWSNNWAIGIKRDNPVSEEQDPIYGSNDIDFGRSFNGGFYVCDKDNFITKINFDSGFSSYGFRGGTFNVFFNSFGPGAGTTPFEQRQSIQEDIQQDPNLRYEYQVFLEEPDLLVCPLPTLSEYSIVEPLLTRCDATEYCFNLSTNGLGQIEVLIDLNNNGTYDGDAELILIGAITESDLNTAPVDGNYPYEICVPWNGQDGNGMPINTDNINIQINFRQGVFHFPVHDIEYNDIGFDVQAIRPCPCTDCSPGACNLNLFFDDSKITETNTLGPKEEFMGCMAPCHAWASGDLPNFGDRNTINTWWYAFSTSDVVSINPQLDFVVSEIQGTDVICPDEATEFTVASFEAISGLPITQGLEYLWIGPNGFTTTGLSTGPISNVGVYTVEVTNLETRCVNEASVELIAGSELECCFLDVELPEVTIENFDCIEDLPAANSSIFNVLNACYGEPEISSTDVTISGDGCPGSPLVITRTWTITDSDGDPTTTDETITFEQTYNFEDNIAPVIETSPSEFLFLPCESSVDPVNTGAPTWFDNCSGTSITINFTDAFDQDPNCSYGGTLTRTFTGEDQCGNITSFVQVIIIADINAPTINNFPTNIELTCGEMIPAPIDDVNAEGVDISDNCSTDLAINLMQNSFNDNGTPGCPLDDTYTRIYFVEDECGQNIAVNQVITYSQEVTPPMLVNVPDDITLTCAEDVPEPAEVTAVGDACFDMGSVNFTETVENEICKNQKTIVRTWTVTDACWNSTSAMQTITLDDTIAPQFSSTPADITVNCDAVPDAEILTAVDNCDDCFDVIIDEGGEVCDTFLVVVFDEAIDNTDCECTYTITRTWTTMDNCGNEAIHTQTIAVIDNDNICSDIEIECPPNITVEAGSPVIWDEPTATTDCPESQDTVIVGCPEPNLHIPGFIYMGEFNNSQYYCSASSDYTWTEANAFAQSAGGHLVVINDSAENEYIRSNIMTSSVWIGANDAQNEGTFQWVDNSPFTYSNWDTGNPNSSSSGDDYVRLKKDNGKWKDRTNSYKYEFVMEIPCGEHTPPVIDCTSISNHIPGFIFMGEFNNSKYYCSSTNSFTWSEANNISQSNGGHLASINDAAENDFLANIIGATYAWIGFTDQSSEGNFSWINNDPVTYTNWYSGEPNDQDPGGYGADYTVLKNTGKWFDRKGSGHYEFIMEIPCEEYTPPVIDCTNISNYIPGFIFMGEFNNSKYYCSSTNSFTWSDANSISQSNGGHLASINDAAENDFLANIIGATYAWIGFTDQSSEGNFSWINNDPVTYTNWYSGEPNDQDPGGYGADYTVLKNTGKWFDRKGSGHYEFIMEIPCEETTPGTISGIEIDQISGPANGSVLTPGIHIITYEASDECGNTATCTFTVEVEEPCASCVEPENIALHRPTYQSCTYYSRYSHEANDGNTNGSYYANSFSQTCCTTNANWQVNLESEACISYINIWNTIDDCWRNYPTENFYVFVSASPFPNGGLDVLLNDPDVTSFYFPGEAGYPTNIPINATGQYVMVMLADYGKLSLAEVEVFGCYIDQDFPTTGSFNNDCGWRNRMNPETLPEQPVVKTDAPSKELNVYPNPAIDFINIDMRAYAGRKGTMMIVDNLGRVLYSTKYGEIPDFAVRKNLIGYNHGSYSVVLQVDSGRTFTKQFFIENDTYQMRDY